MDCCHSNVSLCVILRSSPGGVIKLPWQKWIIDYQGTQLGSREKAGRISEREGITCVFSVKKTLRRLLVSRWKCDLDSANSTREWNPFPPTPVCRYSNDCEMCKFLTLYVTFMVAIKRWMKTFWGCWMFQSCAVQLLRCVAKETFSIWQWSRLSQQRFIGEESCSRRAPFKIFCSLLFRFNLCSFRCHDLC